MDLIDEFVAKYRREYDYFQHAGRLVHDIIESRLASSGTRAIVTSRAKNPDRLEVKLRQRNVERSYASHADIYSDIVDLAGVRIALYFPSDRKPVVNILEDAFIFIQPPKEFKGNPKEASGYQKRFSGYWASHYRLRLRDSKLTDAQKRYSEASVEVQVASVLMHAWAEVEHDLIYKPLRGMLSTDEYAILDELNGLVLAGEIALERLHRAIENRVAASGAKFANHFELAAFVAREITALSGKSSEIREAALGRVDILFDLLVVLGLDSVERVRPLLDGLHDAFEIRAISEQIVDQVVAYDYSNYEHYLEIRHRHGLDEAGISTDDAHKKFEAALGKFVRCWVELETELEAIGRVVGFEGPRFTFSRVVTKHLDRIGPEAQVQFNRVRLIRNRIIHGEADLSLHELKSATREVKALVEQLRSGRK